MSLSVSWKRSLSNFGFLAIIVPFDIAWDNRSATPIEVTSFLGASGDRQRRRGSELRELHSGFANPHPQLAQPVDECSDVLRVGQGHQSFIVVFFSDSCFAQQRNCCFRESDEF